MLRYLSVSKNSTRFLDGNAARSKIKDFRTALYPRQYHPSVLENRYILRFFAYKVFFRRACQRKNRKCSITDERVDFEVYRQTENNGAKCSVIFCYIQSDMLIFPPKPIEKL